MFSRFFSSSSVALAALQLASTVSAKDVNVKLDIINSLVSPDGFTRSAITVNGSLPGPLISGNIGDRFLVNVTDYLTDPTMMRSTSIHWHGMFHKMDHAVAMDGVSSITQCPIIPGNSFMYNFTVPDQAGTFWYHSHYSTQYCDGLLGPLVIYDPEDPYKDFYDVDDETTVITLNDWYHAPAPSLTNFHLQVPSSTLINGRGRSKDNTTTELSVVPAQVGKRHRFRLISTSCSPAFLFSIDGHEMIIIEADGVETMPLTVDKLEIFAGQRYSVIVVMDKPIDNYWIHAIPHGATNATTDGGINSAILRYEGAPIAEPCHHTEDSSKELVTMNEVDLHPLLNPGAPGEPYVGGADVVLTLTPSFADNGTRFAINNVSFRPPSAPVLLQVLSGAINAKEMLPAGSVYNLPLNSTIEVHLPGDGLNHPFHLHGHVFDVIRSAGSSVYNFENPVRRDVVNIGSTNDSVAFRFFTDNTGPWVLHCHIDWHFDEGLAVVFAEDSGDTEKIDPVNADWSNLCPLYDKHNPDTHFGSTD